MKSILLIIAIAVSTPSFAGSTAGSQTLFESMKAAGASATNIVGRASTYSVRNVFCLLVPRGEPEYTCEMFNVKGPEKYVITDEQARLMGMVLQTLDVAKGTSGAETDYISCTHDPDREYMNREYTCYVATIIECDEDVCH